MDETSFLHSLPSDIWPQRSHRPHQQLRRALSLSLERSIMEANVALKRCQWAFSAWGLKANLKCDKLRIGYADCSSKSPECAADKMREYFWEAHIIYLPQRKPISLTLKRKSLVPFVRLLPGLCCLVPVQWWEALDLSQIAQLLPGMPVCGCELRKGRLWIAEVVPAFYQNDPRFRN